MEESNKKPAVRFTGFADPWEQRELTGEVELYSGLTYSPNDIVKENGTLVLRSSNVKNGEVIDADNVYVNPDAVNSSNVKKGDIIVVVRNGSRSLIGKHAQIKAKKDNTVIGAFMTGLRSNHSEFINALLDTQIFKDEIEKNLGATINQITNGMFHQMKFLVPSPKEQDRIGETFTGIDNLITLHQRKYDKLKNVKKSCLEKMFPKEGENIPEIRFAGFTEPWEQRKVGEMTSVASAARVHKEEWAASGVPFFRSSDVVSAYKGTANDKVYISYNLFEQLSQISGKLEKDDILVTGGGSIGIPYIVPNNAPLYSKDADLIWIKHSESFDSKYLYFFFEAPYFRSHVGSISHIGTIAHYTIEQVKDTPIFVSTIDEQKQIGLFFEILDNRITLQQRKLNKLQNIKKSFLEKMFV